ncbi:MAG: hypothetical protein IJ602_00140 [Paludibacteraceae bacterium]|nr:hypothetical protein [Paludibacteraceae bacterium]
MKRILLTLFVVISAITLLVTSCGKWSHFDTANDFSEDIYSLYDTYTDEFGNEGIVVYKKDSGKTMLVLSADEVILPWGPTNEKVYLGDSIAHYAIEYGVTMLQCMCARGIERFPAMDWCNRKNGEKLPYSGSWRLPTEAEWEIMLWYDGVNLPAINSALKRIGGDTIAGNNALYWLCEEDYENYIKISMPNWDYNPYDRAVAETATLLFDLNKDHWIKSNSHRVRAMKHVIFK